MPAEMMALVERLVFAIERVSYNVENISQDVKDMSVSLQTLTYNVSHLLEEKKPAEDGNQTVATWDNEQQDGIGNSCCEQNEVRSVSHTDELNLENFSFADKNIKREVNYDAEETGQLHSMYTAIDNGHELQRDSVTEDSGNLLAETDSASYPSTSDSYTEPFSSEFREKKVRGPVSPLFVDQSSSCGKYIGEYVNNGSEEREARLINEGSESEHSGVWMDIAGATNQQERSTERSGKQNRPFLCVTCGKCCSGRADLERHHWVHTGAKPFACPMCEKAYRDKGNLRIHMRVHTGERPCKCSVCGKSFTQGYSLKCHMLTHTGEKPFNCTECGRAFSMKSSLAVHRRTHTGERPYACSICGKRFTQSQHVSRHMGCFHRNS